jgi:hypothetical protein
MGGAAGTCARWTRLLLCAAAGKDKATSAATNNPISFLIFPRSNRWKALYQKTSRNAIKKIHGGG